MPHVPIRIPPGVVRAGVRSSADGRWYDTNLIRWVAGVMQAVGGWARLQTSGGVDLNPGIVRGMLAWRGTDGAAQLAYGTATKLYHFAAGVQTDITPADLGTGLVDEADVDDPYGSGAYGSGNYNESPSVRAEAHTWAMDVFGEWLMAVGYADRRLLKYDPYGSSAVAAVVAGAPQNNRGVVVTPERFCMLLGAEGNDRRIAWASQETITDWDFANADNTAGTFDLSGFGAIMCGRRGKGESLIWTSTDLWGAQFIGLPLVFGFTRHGTNCGPASRHAVAVIDGSAVWMGRDSFFKYDGFVTALPSDVNDYVFSDINRDQISKVCAYERSSFGEVWWHYPSSGSTENDRYVVYNYRENWWAVGALPRTSGVDVGPFAYPLVAGGGYIYEHEKSTAMPDAAGAAMTPYAESGPFMLSEGGDHVMHVLQYVPDENTLGNTELSIYGAMDPTSAETMHGPFTSAQPTDVRFLARQIRLRVEQAVAGWRLGTIRLDLRPGGKR